MAGMLRQHLMVLGLLLLSATPTMRAVNMAPHSASEPVVLVDSKLSQKPKAKGDEAVLPSMSKEMAQLSMGLAGLVVALAVIALACLSVGSGSKVKEPRPAAEVNKEVGELTKQREDIVKEVSQLEERIEKLRKEAEEEARKAEIAEAQAAAAAAAAYEAEHAGDAPSEEQLQAQKEAAESEEAVMATLAKVEEEVQHIREFAEKAEAKAVEVKTAVVTGAEQALVSIEKFAQETVETVTGEVKDVLNTAVTEDEILEWTENAEEVGGVAFTMPLPLLLAGVFAPAQLQIIKTWNNVLMMLQLPLLLMFTFAMAWDHGKKCHDGFLWTWSSVIAAMLGLNVLLRYAAVKSAEQGIQETHSVIEEHGIHNAFVGGSTGTLQRWELMIHRFWVHLTSSGKEYFKVLLVYDSIVQSSMYSLISFLNFAIIVWGGIGVHIVIQYAVQEETQCDANVLRVIVRLYCFVYVVMLIYSIIGLVLWLVEALIMSQAVSLAILQKAWDFDSHYSPSGVPILSLLVRSLLLRNSSDMAALELSILNTEISELRLQKDELAAEEEELDSALTTAQVRLEVVSQNAHLHASADELAEIYAHELTGMMDKAAVFGVMAQNLYDKYGPAAIERAKTRSLELLAEAQEEAEMLSQAAKAKATETYSMAQARASEYAKDPRFSQGLQSLQQQGAALAGMSLADLQAQAEEAAKVAEAKAQELAAAGKKKAHEAGLDKIDVAQLQQQAKEAAEQVVLAAIHKAEEAGLDINKLIQEAEHQAEQIAKSAQEAAISAQQGAKEMAVTAQQGAQELAQSAQERLAAEGVDVQAMADTAKTQAESLAHSAQDAAQSAASKAQVAAASATKQMKELSESEQAVALQKQAGQLQEQLEQAASAGKEAVEEHKSSWFGGSKASSSKE